jgi:hypothetical protein
MASASGSERLDRKLNDTNYLTWTTLFRCLLFRKKLISKGIKPQEEVVIDEGKDDLVYAELLSNVEENLFPVIQNAGSGEAALEALDALFKSKTKARKIELRRQFNSLRMEEGEAVSRFASRAQELQGQLTSVGHDIKTQEVVEAVIAGLPQEYDVISTILMNQGDDLDISEVLQRLLPVEAKLQGKDARGDTGEAHMAKFKGWDSNRQGGTKSKGWDSGKSKGNGSGWDSSKNKGRGSSWDSSKRCHYCNKRGHLKRDCLHRKRDERTTGGRDSDSGVALVADQNVAIRDAQKRRDEEAGDRDSGRKFVLLGANLADEFCEWVLDSGASNHICGDKRLFKTLEGVEENITIVFGDGKELKVEGKGDVVIKTREGPPVTLNEVMFVPGSVRNLLSLGQATQRGATVEFKRDMCWIKHGDRVVMKAQRSGGLFKVASTKKRDKDAELKGLMARIQDDAALWHRRFGHLSYGNLQRMAEDQLVDGLNIEAKAFRSRETCEPCIMAKQAVKPFKGSKERSKRKLDVIHMDVCGPLPQETLGGARYFATFVDDHTRYSEVRFLKKKSDVAAEAKAVFRKLENQTGLRIKKVKSDNGGEYVNTELKEFYAGAGIIHQRTPPYTPQHNGVAERLNRTLLEKERAMRIAANLPKSTWGESLATANYLRNISPASGQERTPWELFHGKKPDVSHLRVYGSRVYVKKESSQVTKLEARSEKGCETSRG